jgi:hypothetical protein
MPTTGNVNARAIQNFSRTRRIKRAEPQIGVGSILRRMRVRVVLMLHAVVHQIKVAPFAVYCTYAVPSNALVHPTVSACGRDAYHPALARRLPCAQ